MKSSKLSTPWYYDYYECGAFPHQQELCEKVTWTGCDLEGRNLINPTLLGGIQINPLTLRLRATKIAINKLSLEINRPNKVFKRQKYFGVGGKLHLGDSKLKTGGAALEEITFDDGQMLFIHYDKIHFALFEFFTNAGSILDRLAYEINLLYRLGDWIDVLLDWNRVTNAEGKYFQILKCKDPDLACFINNARSKFNEIPLYRNRLIHDGMIKAMVNPDFRVYTPIFQVNILKDTEMVGSENSENALTLCKRIKSDICKLLDGSYELILRHIEATDNPPW